MSVEKIYAVIEHNKSIINNIMDKSPVLMRTKYMKYFRSQVSYENTCLFPRPTLNGRTVHKFAIKLNKNYMKNQQVALKYITAIQNMDKPIDNEQIKNIHSLLCDSDESIHIIGGLFRTANVRLQDFDITPPDWTDIQTKLNKIYDYVYDPDISPVQKAICAHLDIIRIQPFPDYNKRTARLLMNMILIRGGYRPIIFNHSDDWKQYLGTIAASGEHKDKYIEFMLKTMIRTQEDIIRLLQDKQRK